MLFTVLAAGSRGDVQPYIALGLELKKAGHRIRIATFRNYEDFVKRFGLEFFPISGDITKVALSDDTRDARQADNPLKLVLSFNKLKSYVFDLQDDFFEACAGSDAIVYHPGMPIGYFAARDLNIPSILATPFPMAPTVEYPALMFYNTIRLGRRFNRISHRIFEQVMWLPSSSAVKEFWMNKFGHAPDDFACPFGRQTTRTHPTIISCSEHVFPQPKDWPAHVTSTGYWFLEDAINWKPSAALEEFLHKGTPPVYVGFGSIGDPTQAVQTTELVIDALKRSGQRGILATGWSGMSEMEDLPEDLFVLESAPHSWLFPRMAVVVHHGGAGTTAAGLRAGVPSIIVPHGNDQFAWGRRVYELGAGTKPIPRRKLTAEKLSEAIKSAMKNEIKDSARELGLKIQTENGTRTAARIVLNTLEQGNPE